MNKIIFKMLIVTGMFTAAVVSSNAQISKGSLMLGGSLGAKMTMEKTSKKTTGSISQSTTSPGYTEWNFSPSIGYFVADGFVVGLGLNFESKFLREASSYDNTTKENIMISGLGVSLIVRKYFEVTNNVYFHTQAGIGYSSMSAKNRVEAGFSFPDQSSLKDGENINVKSIAFNITPGLTYFISPKWGIDFSLNNVISYNSSNIKEEGPSSITNAAYIYETSGGEFLIGAGLTPSLGLFYYINK